MTIKGENIRIKATRHARRVQKFQDQEKQVPVDPHAREAIRENPYSRLLRRLREDNEKAAG